MSNKYFLVTGVSIICLYNCPWSLACRFESYQLQYSPKITNNMITRALQGCNFCYTLYIHGPHRAVGLCYTSCLSSVTLFNCPCLSFSLEYFESMLTKFGFSLMNSSRTVYKSVKYPSICTIFKRPGCAPDLLHVVETGYQQ